MTTRSYAPRRSVALMAATAAAAAITATLSSAPPARATCASFWGLGNSSECQSTLFSVAIAIGTGARASATGLFGTAFAVGTNADASTTNPFSFGITVGDDSKASAEDVFGVAVNLGAKGTAGTNGDSSLLNLGFNIAVNIAAPGSNDSLTSTGGIGNIAANIFGYNADVLSLGFLNTATNLGGRNTEVRAGDFGGTPALNTAVKVGGDGGKVTAGPGPVAIAVSVFQNSDVVKQGPGININGIVVGGAAATRNRAPSTAAAAPVGSKAPKAQRSAASKSTSAARGRR